MDTTETQNRQGSRDKARATTSFASLGTGWAHARTSSPSAPPLTATLPTPVTELPRNADDFWGGADTQEVGSEPTSGPASERNGAGRYRACPASLFASVCGPGSGYCSGWVCSASWPLSVSCSPPPVVTNLRPRYARPARTTHPRLPLGSTPEPPICVTPRLSATPAPAPVAQHVSRVRARHAAGVRHRASVRRRAEPRRRERPSARRHRQHRSAPTAQAVKYTPSNSGATSDDTGSSLASSAPAGDSAAPATSSAPATTSPVPSTASSASTGNSSSSSNQPAIGANGTLGPGSSPDG